MNKPLIWGLRFKAYPSHNYVALKVVGDVVITVKSWRLNEIGAKNNFDI